MARLTELDYKKAMFGVSHSIYNDEAPDTKDIDILFHATKKQVAKKVLIMDGTYKKYRCRGCGGAIKPRPQYCPHCGQKLEW